MVLEEPGGGSFYRRASGWNGLRRLHMSTAPGDERHQREEEQAAAGRHGPPREKAGSRIPRRRILLATWKNWEAGSSPECLCLASEQSLPLTPPQLASHCDAPAGEPL